MVVPFDYDLAANPQQIEYEARASSSATGRAIRRTACSIRWAMSAIQPP
jgi:hypothetical protein